MSSLNPSSASSSPRRPHRFARIGGPLEMLLDLACWACAATVAVYLRYELEPARPNLVALGKFIPLTALVQGAVGLAIGLYRRRWRYGSFEEVKALVATVALTTVALVAIDIWYLGQPIRHMPLSAVVYGGVVGLVLMAGVRYTARLWIESHRRPSGEHLQRVLVFGAGEGGLRAVTSMLNEPESPYTPVGLLDDDPSKRRLSLKGVSVLGTADDLVRLAAERSADAILIAAPSMTAAQVNRISGLADEAGLDVKVLPSVEELFGSQPMVSDIRDLNEVDLLGRHQITTDIDSIAGYLRGKRVMVTGAGGSIGSELCRQLVKYDVADLMMLDRDESALHAVQLSITGRAMLDDPNLILADIRDENRLLEIFDERRPHVVFHSAALKHLPLLEQYPTEAFKTNVVGTLNVLNAALAAGVTRFVNISTDKAANPVCVLGYSKRVAERLTSWAADAGEGVYLSVRFGNVLGSRGSVLTTFRAQIAAGGPVTVTDPEVTRFFMTIPEAVQLVIQAGAIGRDREVLVLDMGEPVSINEVAQRMIRNSGKPIRIIYSGLRTGEKMHEELFGLGETDQRPIHAMISHAHVPPLGGDDINAADAAANGLAIAKWMAERCHVPPNGNP
jgi:FlaA1/EpsC-like NDP-sugar epimerase